MQSLISGAIYHVSISIEAKLCLENDPYSPVVPSDTMASQHLTESHPTIYDIDDSGSVFGASNVHHEFPNLSERFLLPSWKEISLPGHKSLSPSDANAQDGSPSNFNCLSRDTLGDGMGDREYESSEDDSEEILERLQESEQLSRDNKAQNAIGDFKHLCISKFSLSIVLVDYMCNNAAINTL